MIWEYLFTYFNRETFEVSGSDYESDGIYSVHELGKRSWELVSISGWQLDKAVAIFKRPKLPEKILKSWDEEYRINPKTGEYY